MGAEIATGIGNTVGQIVPWPCPNCGRICRVSEFEGNVVQGSRCPKCRKEFDAGKQIQNAAQDVAVTVGNTVGQIIPWPCPNCGIICRVSDYEGNVVSGAKCKICRQKVDVFKQIQDAPKNIGAQFFAALGNTYGDILPWKCVRCGEWERISNFNGNIVTGAYCPNCSKEIPIEFDLGDIIFQVTMKQDQLVQICQELNELIACNIFLYKKYMDEAKLQVPPAKTGVDYTFYVVRVGGGVLAFLGGSELTIAVAENLASSPGKLSKLAKLFTSGVLKGCASFAGGIIICIAAEQLIGAIFSYFKGEQLKAKIQEMNDVFLEQLEYLSKLAQRPVHKKEWRKVYEDIREGRCKITVTINIVPDGNLGDFLK